MVRAVALAGSVIALAAGCGVRTRAEIQRRHAQDLEPAALQPTPTSGGAIGTARVRVYPDEDFQAQTPDHEAKIRLLLERASQLLEPTIGLRLQVVEIRSWRRPGGDHADLQAALEQLESLDPGRDVDLVIGLVDALSRVSTDLHELGRARMLGHHVIVRGLDDATEVKVLEDALSTLGKRDRQNLYSRRKRHKEQVILLHEVGHALGGMHVTGERDILNPLYHPKVADFGRANAELMRGVAAARLARGPGAAGREWRKVLEMVRRRPSETWNEDEKAALVLELESRAQGAGESAEQGEALGEGVRATDREHFRAAERLHAAGQPLDAWEELEPLLDFYPDEPGVNRLACRLAVAAERDRAAVAARCGRAAEVAPGDPEPHLRLAQSHLAAKDRAKSLAEARKALDVLERAGAGATASERVWADLAAHFQALGAVTWAERAAGRAGNARQAQAVLEWARTTRVRFSMPAGGPVPPEREAEYVAGLTDLLGDVYARRFAQAERRAAQLQRVFGRAAGLPAARCDMEVRRARYAAARAHCREALRRYADSAWAHYLLGLLDKRDRKPAAAAEHLERAIALDPALKHAYQVAAEIYDQLGKPAEKKRLAEAYRTRFGQALP